jgi:osmotically-inducible protein OsmY
MNNLARTALLLSLLAVLSSCATSPPRTPAEREADRKTEHDIARRLNNDPNILATHIDVSVNRGVATLSGFVTEDADLNEAIRVVSSTPGVTEVDNQLDLELFGTDPAGGGNGAR